MSDWIHQNVTDLPLTATYNNTNVNNTDSNDNCETDIPTRQLAPVRSSLCCKYCEKTFTRSIYRKEHERLHTGERPFSCSYCNKTFSSHGTWRKHEKVHSRLKVYHCELCGKQFFEFNSYKLHQRIHTGEKPHQCTVCGKSFSFEPSLRKHVCSHAGEGPYQCKLCQKSYMTSYDLRIHTRSHTGENPYSCQFCCEAFTTGRRRNLHEKSHMKGVDHCCKICGRYFQNPISLNFHLNMHLFDSGNSASSVSNMTMDVPFSLPFTKDKNVSETENGKEEINFSNDQPSKPHRNSSDLLLPLSGSDSLAIKEEPTDGPNYISLTKPEPSDDSLLDANNCQISSDKRSTDSPHLSVTPSNIQPDMYLNVFKPEVCAMGTQTEQFHTCLQGIEGEIFACKHCEIFFKDYTMFLIHKTLHPNQNQPFACQLCQKTCKDKVEFSSHLMWHMK